MIWTRRGGGGLDGLGGRLARLLLAASLGRAVLHALRGLQRLEVLPGAQQRRVVDQRVHQLPASTNPAAAGRLAQCGHLDP